MMDDRTFDRAMREMAAREAPPEAGGRLSQVLSSLPDAPAPRRLLPLAGYGLAAVVEVVRRELAAHGLRVLLQPAHDLADELAPADAKTPGAVLLQKLKGALGEEAVDIVVVSAVLNENPALDGAYAPQAVQEPGRFCLRVMDGYLDHAQLPRLCQQAADHGAGYPQLAGYVALLLLFQIIAAGYIHKPLSFILTDIQRAPSLCTDIKPPERSSPAPS